MRKVKIPLRLKAYHKTFLEFTKTSISLKEILNQLLCQPVEE